MSPRRLPAILLSLSFLAPPAAGQEPEIIHLDPNQPLLEEPPAPGPAGGRAPRTGALPGPGEGVDAREILAGLWFKQRALLERGESGEARRQAEIALEFMEREGLRAAPEIAAAFLADARRALVEGDFERAGESFALASRFQPSLFAAHVGMGIALWRADRDAGGAAREFWRAAAGAVTDPATLYHLGGNGLLLLYLGLAAGAVAALLILAFRNVPALLHDLEERFSGRLPERAARLAGWALVAAPLAALLPPAWVVAAWGVLFYPYLRGRERAVAVVSLLLLVLAAPVGWLVAWHFGTAADPRARALVEAVRRGPDLRSEGALRTLMRDHPDDGLFPFLLAVAYKAGGRLDEAMGMYREVIRVEPRHARAMVNLGNIHALRQEYAVAQRYYTQASRNDPSLALAHYNSHLAHLETFHLEAADQELREARRLDESLVNGLLARASEGMARRTPVDAVYSAAEIWKRVLPLRLEGAGRAELARAALAPASVAGVAGLVATLMVPGLGVVPRRHGARRCRRCGRAYCRRCQVAGKHTDVCAQCTHLFVLRDGLAPGVKAKKMEEVARFRRRHFFGARTLGLLFPGGGHVLGGRTLMGTILMVLWASALAGLALRGRILVNPEQIAPAGGALAAVPALGVAVIAWLVGNFSSHERGRG
ncbi:MAG: hypothetical protein ACE5JH_00120 [Acidobacteriota bacterium]